MPLADLQEERIELVQEELAFGSLPAAVEARSSLVLKVIPHSSITPPLKCFGEGALLTRVGSDTIPGLFQL